MDNKTIKSRPKEFFLHLLAIVTLYISAGSFITLLFQFWNYLLPDFAQEQYGYNNWIGPMRFAVASLIIVFPVFAGVSAFLEKLYKMEPDLRELRVRRWLLNFTLFVAALVIIGDFISIVYNLISGEIALRFILKALSILFTTLLIFGYYFIDLKHAPAATGLYSGRNKKLIAYVAIAAVVISIVCSFFVMGSPFAAREKNIDNIRVSNLQQIQYEIINYWQAKGSLPANLESLNDATRGVIVPVDPETGAAYTYKTTDNLSFDLCATFATDSATASSDSPNEARPAYPKGAIADTWSHGIGETCFHRTIDPAFYPPYTQVPVKPLQ